MQAVDSLTARRLQRSAGLSLDFSAVTYSEIQKVDGLSGAGQRRHQSELLSRRPYRHLIPLNQAAASLFIALGLEC